MAEIFRCTKPGGYAEIAGVLSNDKTIPDNNGTKVWAGLATKMGIKGVTVEMLKRWLEGAGFVDVKVECFKQPLGPFAKEPRLKMVGAMMLLNGVMGYRAYGMAALTRVLDIDPKEADRICTNCLKSARDKNSYTYVLYVPPRILGERNCF